jgi:hypothetical protein
MSGLCCLGADEVGFDAESAGTIFKAAGELAQGGLSMYEKSQADKKAKADAEAKAKASIAADANAASTAARAAVSAAAAKGVTSGYTPAAADAAAAQVAAAAAARAGAGLPPEAQAARVAAAEKALGEATKQWQASPKDAYKAALVKAWEQTLQKAQNAQIVSNDAPAQLQPQPQGGGESWLTRKVVGPVPGWGVVAAGAVALGGVSLLVKRLVGG